MGNGDTNRYGLSRYIPSDVKRQIRQNCGFGCVICGSAYYTYEHVDPLFVDATEHDPSRMTLLCGTHQQNVTAGRLSKDTVKRAAENPKCLERGFSFGELDIGLEIPDVGIGSVTWKNTPVIIEAMGERLLEIETPEEESGPFRLSGKFFDNQGQEIFRIERNEWLGPAENWDIEVVGPRTTIRRARREITLQMVEIPPNKILIERLDMYFRGFRIISDTHGTLEMISPTGQRVFCFTPVFTKTNIESLASIPDVVKEIWLARYEDEEAPGVTWTGCEAGITVFENGQLLLGKGGMPSPGGGSILVTF